MSIIEVLTLFLVTLSLAAMPSLSVALVVSRTIVAGRINGAFAALGIVAGDLVFIVLALVGMTLLAGWLGMFFVVIKYFGAAYLIWFGYCLLTYKSSKIVHTVNNSVSLMGNFFAGLFFTLGDVKAILFYASLFPALIDIKTIGLWDILLIVAITIMAVGGVKFAYVLLAEKIFRRIINTTSELPHRLGGMLMIGCGSFLITKT